MKKTTFLLVTSLCMSATMFAGNKKSLLPKGEYSFVIFDVASLHEFLKPGRGKTDVFLSENYPRIVFRSFLIVFGWCFFVF